MAKKSLKNLRSVENKSDKPLEEKGKGLWHNIHKKRDRGEKPLPKGHPDRPTDADFKRSQNEAKIDLKDLRLVDYKPGATDQENHNARKRKKSLDRGLNDDVQVNEAPRRPSPPKMKHMVDPVKKEREKSRAHDAAMGRTVTGRKKPQRTMTSTQRSLADIRRRTVDEKTLTPAELKKREEIAKAMERDNPGMDMSKKMAIATAQAKKVAEEVEQIEEDITKMSHARLKYHVTKNFPHGRYSSKEIDREHKRRQKAVPNYHTVKPALESANEEWKKDSGWKKPEAVRKDKFGNTIKTKNVAKNLAKASAKKSAEMAKEEVEQIDEVSNAVKDQLANIDLSIRNWERRWQNKSASNPNDMQAPQKIQRLKAQKAALMKKHGIKEEAEVAETSLYDKIKAARANPSLDKPVRGRGSKNRNPKTYDPRKALDKEDDRIQATIKKSLKKEEVEQIEEALDISARRKRSLSAKRNRSKLAMGRKRAANRMADMDKLRSRARKAARAQIVKKMLKDVPKDELSPARKQEIEKRVDKLGPRIDQIAKKILPKIRQAEVERKKG